MARSDGGGDAGQGRPVGLDAGCAGGGAGTLAGLLGVAGLTALAAALRFSTLGLQSYHHDEIVTASRILRGGFWHAMSAVGFSESAPPLYYALAWLWTQLTGTGEFGLRSISALAGVATVPVAYLIAAELRGRRAGIAAAALVAVNPMLLWYSQEARAYALFSLLTRDLAALLRRARCVAAVAATSSAGGSPRRWPSRPTTSRSSRSPPRRLWLLRRRGRARSARPLDRRPRRRCCWRRWRSTRCRSATPSGSATTRSPTASGKPAMTFMVGETGDIIARPVHPLLALVPALLVVAALALLLVRGERGERRAAGIPLAIAGATVALPVVLALASPSKDYVLARNLMPALVPLLVAVAIAVTARRARRAGAVARRWRCSPTRSASASGPASRPSLQRPDWDAVAARLGEPAAPRAIVTWILGEAPLRYYLSSGSFQVSSADGFGWLVHEVDFVSDGPAPPLAGAGCSARASAGRLRAGRAALRAPLRAARPGPGAAARCARCKAPRSASPTTGSCSTASAPR